MTVNEKESPATVAAQDERQLLVSTTPSVDESAPRAIVYVKKKRRKKAGKKRGQARYTGGLRDAQEMQLGLARASYRLSNAVARGFDRFYRSSRKSARKKRDGALRELPENAALALGEVAREAGKAPLDVARRVNVQFLVRQTRYVARWVLPPGILR